MRGYEHHGQLRRVCGNLSWLIAELQALIDGVLNYGGCDYGRRSIKGIVGHKSLIHIGIVGEVTSKLRGELIQLWYSKKLG